MKSSLSELWLYPGNFYRTPSAQKDTNASYARVSFQFIDRARHLQKQQKPILPEVSPTATALAEVRNHLFQPAFRNIYVCRCLLYFSQIRFYNHAHLRLLQDISMHNITIAQNISQVLLCEYSVFPLSKV